jgi:hypothetical protein
VLRRELLLGGASLALGACSSRSTSGPGLAPAGGGWRDVSFAPSADVPDGERALLLVPEGGASAPLLIALHGRGEAGRGLDVGAGAWPNEYQLDRLHRRLRLPPLTPADLHEMVSLERLARLNASLAASPYQGLGLACPYTPNLSDRSAEGARGYARFLIEVLLPRLRAETGSNADRAATGIDGVSMGGRLSLLVGLSYPEVFGVVGTLQPALRVDEAPMISALAQAAMAKAKVTLRLVSSEEDSFLPAVRAASDQMRADGVPHELLVIPGTHGYTFNRGPGGAEMLLWHERVQRGLPAP